MTKRRRSSQTKKTTVPLVQSQSSTGPTITTEVGIVIACIGLLAEGIYMRWPSGVVGVFLIIFSSFALISHFIFRNFYGNLVKYEAPTVFFIIIIIGMAFSFRRAPDRIDLIPQILSAAKAEPEVTPTPSQDIQPSAAASCGNGIRGGIVGGTIDGSGMAEAGISIDGSCGAEVSSVTIKGTTKYGITARGAANSHINNIKIQMDHVKDN